jgi:hypothetical protein
VASATPPRASDQPVVLVVEGGVLARLAFAAMLGSGGFRS